MALNLGFVYNESDPQTIENESTNERINEERETWGKSIHFLMSCIAMSVGLGNVWRFPFSAYENGGGAFLLPYIIILFLVGRPVYFLEMCLGQFARKSSLKTFELFCPILKGVGFGQLFVCLCGASYYGSLLVLAIFYLAHSFSANLPWAECAPEWIDNGTICIPSKSRNVSGSITNFKSSAELWFEKEVLKEKTQIDDGIGLPDWKLSLFLFLTWLITFILSARGIKSSGKASYFLALFPYATLLALLIRAVTLDGSNKGVLYFLRPQWNQLLNAKVWYNAITQCFFSLNIGSSIIINFSSFNSFRQNIYRDALIVTSLDTFTSLMSGITIFAILGNLANELGVEVTQVVSSGGTRLAFVSYPDAIAKFESVPWLFAILFFLTLYVLGIGCLVSGQTAINTVISDFLPHLTKWHISLITTSFAFLVGLPYLTPGGQFVLTLVDHFGVTFLFFILTTVEVVVVIWWYGLDNFCNDVEFMLERKLGIYWKSCWGLFTPCVLIAVMAYFLSTLQKLKNGAHEFPDYVLAIGWCLFAFGFCQLFVWWAVFIFKNRDLGFTKAIALSISCENWKPGNVKICEKWVAFKMEKQKEENRNGWFSFRKKGK